MKWVAPNWRAAASFAGLVSTAMIGSASARARPWMTLRPMPPTPMTTTVSPWLDLGPVEHRADAGDDRAADEAGRRRAARPGRSTTACVSFTTVCSVNTPALANWNACSPPTVNGACSLPTVSRQWVGLAAVAGVALRRSCRAW